MAASAVGTWSSLWRIFLIVSNQLPNIKHLKLATILHFQRLLSSSPRAMWPAEPCSVGDSTFKPAAMDTMATALPQYSDS